MNEPEEANEEQEVEARNNDGIRKVNGRKSSYNIVQTKGNKVNEQGKAIEDQEVK